MEQKYYLNSYPTDSVLKICIIYIIEVFYDPLQRKLLNIQLDMVLKKVLQTYIWFNSS